MIWICFTSIRTHTGVFTFLLTVVWWIGRWAMWLISCLWCHFHLYLHGQRSMGKLYNCPPRIFRSWVRPCTMYHFLLKHFCCRLWLQMQLWQIDLNAFIIFLTLKWDKPWQRGYLQLNRPMLIFYSEESKSRLPFWQSKYANNKAIRQNLVPVSALK